jgi:hypothetical protein
VSDLTAFLDARLDEDEAAAKAAWGVEWDWRYVAQPLGERPSIAHTLHIARHDPARVLREVVAKRSLVEDHTGQCCVNDTCCGEIAGYFDSEAGDPCPVLRHLAAIYSDHPDYRQEWAAPSLA